MTSGDTNHFAIESQITDALPNRGQIGLGFFFLYIMGRQFGVRKPDATLLACSYDEVQNRCTRRGNYTAPFSENSNAFAISEGFYDGIYNQLNDAATLLGMPHREFVNIVQSNHLMWAPDGDAAFDDGSFVLHFDIGNQVRLLAFRSTESRRVLIGSVVDVWMEANEFYLVLNTWLKAFELEWVSRLAATRNQ